MKSRKIICFVGFFVAVLAVLSQSHDYGLVIIPKCKLEISSMVFEFTLIEKARKYIDLHFLSAMVMLCYDVRSNHSFTINT
jgi:hypothetical protein